MSVAYVYILQCRDSTFYTGYTTDPVKRMYAHSHGTGSKYVRARLPFSIIYLESCKTRAIAMNRERHIKKLTHLQKSTLSQQPINLLHTKNNQYSFFTEILSMYITT